MNVAAYRTQATSFPPPAAPPAARGVGRLDDVLRAPAAGDRATTARESAEKLVSIALVEPLLAKMHESSLAAGPFAPSSAEKRFAPLLDQAIAERVVHAARFPLVDAVAERLTGGARAGARGDGGTEGTAPRESIDVHA